MKQYIILGISALLATPLLADINVQGIVRDANTKAPLSGVRVQAFSGSKLSTMTDEEGKYSITLPDYVTSIRVERDGYNPQQIPVANHEQGLDAYLFSDAYTDLAGLANSSVLSLSAQVNDLTSDVSIDNQIASSLGGMIRTINRGGVPGMGNYMLLGGINSLNSNAQPLVVVDGVIYDMQYDRESIHDGLYNNLLANISVTDIASVTVLRNGTAIYGAKGANGVIVIETNRSHSYNTKIDVTISGRYEQTPTLPEMMNASEYRTYVSEMLGSTNTKYREFKFLREDPNYYYYKVYHNNTDWTKETYREAFSQQYAINVQGGDDIANYNLSIGFAQSDATLKENNFNRFNLRLNSDVKLTSRVKVRLDAAYSDVNRDMRDDGAPANVDDEVITAPGFLSLIKSPFLSPYQLDTQGNLSSFLYGADDYLDNLLGNYKKEGSLANPTAILHYGEARNKNSFGNRLVSLGITPSADLGHRLTLSSQFNFMLFNTDEGYYTPVFGVPTYRIEGIGYVSNKVQSSSSHQYLTSNDLRLNWKYNHEGHALDLTGGWRFRTSRYQQDSMKGYNSGNDKTPNMSNNLSYRTTAGINEKLTTLTYYAQAAYSLYGKYFVDAAVSMETNTRFGKDAEAAIKMFDVAWGLFPSVSGSWVVSNEKWFKGGNAINYLRLNAGWDLSGNDDITANAERNYFQAVNLYQQITGTIVGGYGNTKIKWETTNRMNVGLDANFWNNRVSVSANFYRSWTKDLLSIQPLDYMLGISEEWVNGGKLTNVGYDVNARVKVLDMKDLKWEAGFSVGHYKNEVTELPTGDIYTSAYGATILTKVGEPVGLFYGYETNGVFSTTAEAEAAGNYITDRTGSKTYFGAGDMNFVNHDDSKEINEADRVVIGNPNPTIYGNITSHLQYKKLGVDMVFNYSLGNDIYNYQRSLLEAGSRFHNQTTAMRGRWSSEGQVTDIPRISYKDPMGNSRFSDRWIEDGSYLRLKNITVSYKWDFDYRFLQGVTLFGSAQNLFTLTKYLGSDPETSISNNVLYQGIDCGQLPTSRNFSVGVKINL